MTGEARPQLPHMTSRHWSQGLNIGKRSARKHCDGIAVVKKKRENRYVSRRWHPSFNEHSPMWGRSISASDERGDTIERFLDINRLLLLNKGDNTHFSLAHNSESAIDHSIPMLSKSCYLF